MGELTHVYVVCRTIYGDWSIDKDVTAVFTSRDAVEQAYGSFQWVWDTETAEHGYCCVARKNELFGYNSELAVHYMPLGMMPPEDILAYPESDWSKHYKSFSRTVNKWLKENGIQAQFNGTGVDYQNFFIAETAPGYEKVTIDLSPPPGYIFILYEEVLVDGCKYRMFGINEAPNR